MNVLIIGGGCSVSADIIHKFTDNNHTVVTTVHHKSCRLPLKQCYLDLLSNDSIAAAAEQLGDSGPYHVVVFATGVQPGASLQDYSDEMIDAVVGVNFVGQAKLLRRLLPHIVDGGRVIFISSVSADTGGYDPVYCAAKSAVNGFVKSIARWLAPHITTVAVAPGLIKDSTMYYTVQEHRRTHHENNTPTGTLTTKEQLATVVYDLCQLGWANVNGQVIVVSGGLHV